MSGAIPLGSEGEGKMQDRAYLVHDGFAWVKELCTTPIPRCAAATIRCRNDPPICGSIAATIRRSPDPVSAQISSRDHDDDSQATVAMVSSASPRLAGSGVGARFLGGS
jgi:hypothetical protein